jgi:hypothetical protein
VPQEAANKKVRRNGKTAATTTDRHAVETAMTIAVVADADATIAEAVAGFAGAMTTAVADHRAMRRRHRRRACASP